MSLGGIFQYTKTWDKKPHMAVTATRMHFLSSLEKRPEFTLISPEFPAGPTCSLWCFPTPHLTRRNVFRTFPIPKTTTTFSTFRSSNFSTCNLRTTNFAFNLAFNITCFLPSNVFQHLNPVPDRQDGLLPIMPFPRGRHVPAPRCHPPPHRSGDAPSSSREQHGLPIHCGRQTWR